MTQHPNFGHDLPPGCRVSDIPGNRPEDAAEEQMWDNITLDVENAKYDDAITLMKSDPLIGDRFVDERQEAIVCDHKKLVDSLVDVNLTLEDIFGMLLYMREESG